MLTRTTVSTSRIAKLGMTLLSELAEILFLNLINRAFVGIMFLRVPYIKAVHLLMSIIRYDITIYIFYYYLLPIQAQRKSACSRHSQGSTKNFRSSKNRKGSGSTDVNKSFKVTS
jgi:hypothetical protein